MSRIAKSSIPAQLAASLIAAPAKNEAETRFELIDPVLREKGYRMPYIKLETKAPVEPIGPKGRRRKGPGRTDYLLCVEVPDQQFPMPIAILEAKKEHDDVLKGMGQAKGYSECEQFDAKYVFSTNGHLYAKFNKFTKEYTGPFPLSAFPDQANLTACYARHTGINIEEPEAAMLFKADSPAFPEKRYYQDAAIRAAFEKVIQCEQAGKPARALLSLATGAGKTIIAANLLWRLHEAGRLPKPALFLCDRDELREQAYNKLKAVFGDNARIVETKKGENAARNARVHIATYQTLGLDDADDGFACFLSEHYPVDAFSVIIIDECHRSAWGKWSEVLKRNPNAIQIGLTATPRRLRESKDRKAEEKTTEDEEITSNNYNYFGDPVYAYTLMQAREDGYLAACEVVRRKPAIDSRVFTKAEVLATKPTNIKTGQPITEADLTKEQYTGRDLDDLLFPDARVPAMCEDLFYLLCENGGPEQKVIIFCNRELHADRVAVQMNNLYVKWCREHEQEPKDDYAFKCMGGPNNGSDMIQPMRGSTERAFVACTVDLLEAGVDIECLNAVVFFRYVTSPIKFYQMLGRGTRIHEATKKYKFWLYDYTSATDLFGTDFISDPPRPGGGGGGGGGGTGPEIPPTVTEMPSGSVVINPQGRFIPSYRDGRDVLIPVDEYRREMVRRVISEAHNLDEFRQLWIESKQRRKLIEHLREDNLNPDLIRDIDHMEDYDIYDLFAHHGYKALALKRADRASVYLTANLDWFESMDSKAASVLRSLAHQFAMEGTDALETSGLWAVPEISGAGGLDALKSVGKPVEVMHEAKERIFAA
jgi:type I restriction enzyme R subunit